MFFLGGLIGIVGSLILVITGIFASNLLKKNESGLVHLLMTFVYICWSPLPIIGYFKFEGMEWLAIGTIFGSLGMVVMVISMIMQTGHLSYSGKIEEDREIWNRNDSWIMCGLLGSSVELLGLFLKSLWIVFLAVAFFISGQTVMFCVSSIFAITVIMYLFNLIDSSLVRDSRLFKVMPKNMIIINIETLVWFSIVSIWMIIN